MKAIFSLVVIMFTTQALAGFDTKDCPVRFSIIYYNITRAPLTKEIKEDINLKLAWNEVKEAQKFIREYRLDSSLDGHICNYSNGRSQAFLQTNNGVDELIIPYNNSLYFRTKVLSFNDDYIELAVDEDSKRIFFNEVAVGESEAVNIQAFSM